MTAPKIPTVVGSKVAAEFLAISENTVRRYFIDGRFPDAWLVGNQIRIPIKNLEALKKRPFKTKGGTKK